MREAAKGRSGSHLPFAPGLGLIQRGIGLINRVQDIVSTLEWISNANAGTNAKRVAVELDW